GVGLFYSVVLRRRSRSATSCARPVRFDSMRSRRLRYGTRTPPIVRTTRRGYALAKVTRHATARMPTRGSSPMIVIGFRAISSASSSAAALYGGANGQACSDYRVHVMLSPGKRLGPDQIA